MEKLVVEDSPYLSKKIEALTSRVMKRYADFKNEHNATQHLGRYTHLRTPHLKCFEAIIFKYVPMFRSLVFSPLWADSDVMPRLTITRQELANLVSCSKRNIYNLLVRLSHAGVINIVEESASGYILAPHPYFLIGEGKPEVKVFQEDEKSLLFRGEWQTLPHLNNKERNLNNQYIGIGVESTPENSQRRHQRTDQRIQEAEPLVESSKKNPEKISNERIENQAAESVPVDNELASTEKSVDELRNRYFGGKSHQRKPKPTTVKPSGITEREKKEILENFWAYACSMLYANYTFDAKMQEQIKGVIYRDVFGSFYREEGPNDYIYWKTFAFMRMAEVDMLVKHNQKFGREAFFPTSYFARKYTHRGGFLSAHGWTKRVKKKFKESLWEEQLAKAKYSTLTCRIPHGMRDKILDMRQLVQYWLKILSQRTSKEIVQKYYEYIATQKLIWKTE